MGVIQVNSFLINGGIGLFQELSFLNHNCVPNALMVTDMDSPNIKLLVVKTISAGSQLTISYTVFYFIFLSCKNFSLYATKQSLA